MDLLLHQILLEPLPAISGASLTNLTGASAGTFGDAYTVPTVTVDSNGRITGISTVSTFRVEHLGKQVV